MDGILDLSTKVHNATYPNDLSNHLVKGLWLGPDHVVGSGGLRHGRAVHQLGQLRQRVDHVRGEAVQNSPLVIGDGTRG